MDKTAATYADLLLDAAKAYGNACVEAEKEQRDLAEDGAVYAAERHLHIVARRYATQMRRRRRALADDRATPERERL